MRFHSSMPRRIATVVTLLIVVLLVALAEVLLAQNQQEAALLSAPGALAEACLNLGVSSVPLEIPSNDVATLNLIEERYPELVEWTQDIRFTEILTHTARDELCDALANLEKQKVRIE